MCESVEAGSTTTREGADVYGCVKDVYCYLVGLKHAPPPADLPVCRSGGEPSGKDENL